MEKDSITIAICTAYATEELVVTRLINLYNAGVKRGIKEVIFAASTGFFTENANYTGDINVFKNINYDDFDAVICFSEIIKDENILGYISKGAAEAGIPVFMLERHVDGCIDINFDYVSAFEDLCRHVIEEHRPEKINFMAGIKDNDFSKGRENVFRKVMKENGREVDERNIYYGGFWEVPAEAAMKQMFEDNNIPDALICANDAMAIVASNMLMERGYKVPEDVIVTGMDGIERARWHEPEITTCEIDEVMVGEYLVDMVLDWLDGKRREEKYTIPYVFKKSESCGCVLNTSYHFAADAVFEMFDRNRENQLYQVNMYEMQADISNAENLTEICNILYKYAFTDSYIALDTGISDFFEFPLRPDGDEADGNAYYVFYQAWIGSRNFERFFRSKNMYKDMCDNFQTDLPVIVFPLHFSGDFYGYVVSRVDPRPMFFNKIVMLNYALGNSLGVYRAKKSLMNSNVLLERANNMLAELYVKDHLTKVYNRRGFYNSIKHMILECSEKKWELFIISIDMDDLKGINDKYGHSEGDIALKTFGEAMISAANEHEICSRFGGDEFVIAGIAEDGNKRAREYTGQMFAYLDNFNKTSGKPYTVTGSIGISVTKADSDAAIDEMMLAADQLMYENKKERKKFRSNSRN